MNRFRTTLIIVVVFFALLAFVYFFEKDRESKEDRESKDQEVTQEEILNLNSDEVTKLKIEGNDQTFTFEKKDDKWVLIEDESLDLNELKVVTILEGYSPLKSQTVIESDDLETYGLETPRRKLIIFKGDEETTFEFGTMSPDDSKVYVRKNQENKIFTTPVSLYNNLILSKENLQKNEGADEADAMEEIEKLKMEQELNNE